MILTGASGAFTLRHVLGAELAARASQKRSAWLPAPAHAAPGLESDGTASFQQRRPLAGLHLRESGLDRVPGLHLVGQWAHRLVAHALDPDTVIEPGPSSSPSATASVRSPGDPSRFASPSGDGPFVIAGNGEVGRKVAQLLGDAGEKHLHDRQFARGRAGRPVGNVRHAGAGPGGWARRAP